MQADQTTGEITAELAGKTFRFSGTLRQVADFQAASGVTGMAALWNLIGLSDAQVLHLGLRHLCSSENVDEIDSLPIGAVLAGGPEIIIAALTAGVPPQPEKKIVKARRTPPRVNRKESDNGP